MKPTQYEFPTVLSRDSPVPLESVLCTEELNRRPTRPPDYEAENRALVSLVQELAESPRTILTGIGRQDPGSLRRRLRRRQPADQGGWREKVLLAGDRRRVEAAHRRRHAARLWSLRRRA